MLNNRIKTNIAITVSIATLTVGGYGIYKTNEKISSIKETSKKIQTKMQEEINSLNEQLDSTKKEKDEKDKTLEEANKKIEVLEERVKKNEANIKKLQATNLNLSVSRGLSSRSTRNTQHNSKGTSVSMTLTFYGDFPEENGGYKGIDAQGNKLVAGTIASNYYKFGTKVSFNGKTYTVRDRGGSNFDSPNRIDVFVPRKKGESDDAYKKRIKYYGRKTVTAYVF